MFIRPTGAYGARPVLISRASRSAVASFSQLDADRKVRPKRIYLNRLQQLEKYGDNVRRTVPCTVPIRSAAKSCLLARPAGDRAGFWVPRQLSETRSATAVNGSQMAR